MDEKPQQADAAKRMMQMLWPSALAAQAIYAAARLSVADMLADGPLSAETIATQANADADAVRRLLRALASFGVFCQTDDGRFGQTPLSETLRSGSPARAWAIMLGSPFVWRPWGQLYGGVVTGECAFERVFATSFDEYMEAHPDESEAYNVAMDINASMAVSAVVAAYDFSKFRTIVDVGGGRGALLAGILDANPSARGVLFDLPDVVADKEKLRINRLGGRCVVEGGDYFDHVPGGDALVLKSIIHGLSDEQADRVLRNCRDALNSGGRLLLIENVFDPAQKRDPQRAMMDLMLFTLTVGKERTKEQFEAVLSAVGFELLSINVTERGNAVIEATPRSPANDAR